MCVCVCAHPAKAAMVNQNALAAIQFASSLILHLQESVQAAALRRTSAAAGTFASVRAHARRSERKRCDIMLFAFDVGD